MPHFAEQRRDMTTIRVVDGRLGWFHAWKANSRSASRMY